MTAQDVGLYDRHERMSMTTTDPSLAYRAGHWSHQHPVRAIALTLFAVLLLTHLVLSAMQPPVFHPPPLPAVSVRDQCEQKWAQLDLAHQTPETHSAFVNACVEGAGG
jgi:hypothetical protein